MDERDLLQRLIAGPVSGDALARELGQTRAAVWKRISGLREAGVPVDARPGLGYALAHPMDLLDVTRIRDGLPAALRPQLDAVDVAWSIDSTNSALMAAPAPEGGRARVLLAERQTAGRGRRGRAWASPLAAHLYMSLSRTFAGGLARLGGLSLVAAVATVEALHALGVPQARLKWPNDVVVWGGGGLRKLGGLLVEGGGEYGGPARAVLGLGLNVRMPAASAVQVDQPWCDLAGLGRARSPGDGRVDRNALASAVLAHWLPALDRFDRDGLAPFLPAYAAVDALAGCTVAVQGEHSRIVGRAAGIASDGALQLRLDDGSLRAVHAGEVSVRVAVTDGAPA